MAKVKAVPAERLFEKLSPERRAKVEANAKAMIEEELTLRQLRKALKLSQDELADRLELSQGSTSRIESRADHRVSTVMSYVEALGGKLRLVAEFPGNHSVHLKHMSLVTKKRASAKTKAPKHAAKTTTTPARKRA